MSTIATPSHAMMDHHPAGLLPCLCCGEDRMYIHQSGQTFFAVCHHVQDDNGSDLGGFEGPVAANVRDAVLKYNAMVRRAFNVLAWMGMTVAGNVAESRRLATPIRIKPSAADSASYRRDMKDAGRGHLLR